MTAPSTLDNAAINAQLAVVALHQTDVMHAEILLTLVKQQLRIVYVTMIGMEKHVSSMVVPVTISVSTVLDHLLMTVSHVSLTLIDQTAINIIQNHLVAPEK
jgi:hypothetical protein